MNIIFHLLILDICKFIFSSIVVIPFELVKINFKNEKYSSTDLINILFENEFYTPMKLGTDGQEYFGIISFNDHHLILSESNCEKMNKFQDNENISKKGYFIENSNTKKYLGNTTDYLNSLKFVEFYSEKFWYYNETLNITSKNNNMKFTDIFLIRDNFTKSIHSEMCLSIGLNV